LKQANALLEKTTMKWIRMFAMLGLLAACSCVAQTAADPSSQSSSSPPGLSLSLAPPAGPITLAAPIKIVITVKNTSDKAIAWTAESGDTAYKAFDVLLTKGGRQPETTFLHRRIRRKPRPDDPPIAPEIGSLVVSLLEPGKSFKMTIDLKRLYQITEPGVYILEVSRYDEASKATVHSNRLTLNIAQ
jgi:hypothetical protein